MDWREFMNISRQTPETQWEQDNDIPFGYLDFSTNTPTQANVSLQCAILFSFLETLHLSPTLPRRAL
jgi:hypothetical protein